MWHRDQLAKRQRLGLGAEYGGGPGVGNNDGGLDRTTMGEVVEQDGEEVDGEELLVGSDPDGGVLPDSEPAGGEGLQDGGEVGAGWLLDGGGVEWVGRLVGGDVGWKGLIVGGQVSRTLSSLPVPKGKYECPGNCP